MDHILNGVFTKAQQLQENETEIHAGMLLLEYEPFELDFYNDDPRVAKIVAYKNEERVITFYLRPEVTIGMKVFDLSAGLQKHTAHFPSIGVNDARTIISRLL